MREHAVRRARPKRVPVISDAVTSAVVGDERTTGVVREQLVEVGVLFVDRTGR